MEALLIKIITEAIAAGGPWAVLGVVLFLVGGPAVVVWKLFQSQRKFYEDKVSKLSSELSILQESRTDDLKTVISEANKCMQAVSTAMTTMMVAVDRSTSSNESRLKSWESVSNTLDHFGQALKAISEEMRDLRRMIMK